MRHARADSTTTYVDKRLKVFAIERLLRQHGLDLVRGAVDRFIGVGKDELHCVVIRGRNWYRVARADL